MTNSITSTKAKFLKSCLIFILLAVFLCSCGSEWDKYEDAPTIYKVGSFAIDLKIYTIDSCEYVGKLLGGSTDVLTHKGNCKFCAERAKKNSK